MSAGNTGWVMGAGIEEIIGNTYPSFISGGQNSEQMQRVMTNCMNWIRSIAAQNKLSDKGNRLYRTIYKAVKQ